MVGVVDVVTHVQLANPAVARNPIVGALKTGLGPGLPPKFEVIVDYKGMRRPPVPPMRTRTLLARLDTRLS